MKARRLPNYYTFGKEFEVTGGKSSDEMKFTIEELVKRGILREGWEVHYDSSIVDESGLGFEIVTPPLKDDEQTAKELQFILWLIKESGGYVTEKSSSHTHFGLQCLGSDIEVWQRYLKLHYVFEPEIIKLTTGDLGFVRSGLCKYAIPLQKRVCNVIEGRFRNISEFIMSLEACVGANATYYGPYRYFCLNIQRIVRAISNLPDDCNKTKTIEKLFRGEHVIGKDGKKLSPTIERREPGTTFTYNTLRFELELNGNLIRLAHDKNIDKILNELYEKEKQRKVVVLDKVLPSERESYPDLTDDEILMEKFINSVYGDGSLDLEKVYLLFRMEFPGITDQEIQSTLDDLPIMSNGVRQKNNNLKRLAA